MHCIEILENNKKIYLPENLSECTPKQYVDISELLFTYQTGFINYEMFKYQAIYKLLNLKFNSKKETEEKQSQFYSNLAQIADLTDSFFEKQPNGQITIIQYYINNPIPSIALWKRYYGPSNQFLNITFGEYTDALRLFHQFPISGDIHILRLIAAILYRPQKKIHFIKKRLNTYDGDRRIPYNPKLIDSRADSFKAFPIGFHYGVYLYFASFQKFIATAKIPWGNREIDLSILFDSNSQDTTETIPSIGMDSLLFSIAESGTFGNAESVRKINLWEILIRLYDLRKRDLDQQKQQQNDNNSAT